jgi:hypothetical protein
VAAGTYTITAVATDNIGAVTTSLPVGITVAPDPNRMNMALASNGGVVTASSVLGPNYPASAVINGDRRGVNWGAGGGWNDGTQNAGPDWLEIAFNGPKSIDEVNVFSMQDSYQSPVEPTLGMTFTLWGLRGFDVQYWTGSAWAIVPGGAITNNNLVWRQVLFAPIVTSRIRINVTAALNGYARAIEVEAWGTKGLSNTPPTVSLTSPADGAAFVTPVNITLNANASDSDGTIQQVTFMANGAPVGTALTSPYTFTWNNVPAGTYTVTAVATDNDGAMTTSAPVTITVTAPARANVARASNGGVATASSTLGPNYPASSVINGDRRGLNWGAGGGWNDGTQNAGPDWIEIAFNGSKTIDEVSVFSLQDTYTTPVEPTATMTFTSFGLRAFQVQYWDGAAWVNIPGAAGHDQQPGVAQVHVHPADDHKDSRVHHRRAERLRAIGGGGGVGRAGGKLDLGQPRRHGGGRRHGENHRVFLGVMEGTKKNAPLRLQASALLRPLLCLRENPISVPLSPPCLRGLTIIASPRQAWRSDAHPDRSRRRTRNRDCARGRPASQSDPKFEQISALITQKMTEYGVPGVAFGIVKNGQATVKGFGVTNVDDPLPITPDTVFALASISKTVTATAMMRLVEQGKSAWTIPSEVPP